MPQREHLSSRTDFMAILSRTLVPSLFLAVLVSGCNELPVIAHDEQPTAPTALAVLMCRADAPTLTFSCSNAASQGGGARGVIVGGQNHYVRLTSSGTAYDAGTDVLSTYITVQNLLLTALGTIDGTSADGQGVRVFFASGPTNGVTLANADGTGTFTASNQVFFRYMAELGHGMLQPGITSLAKTWRFNLNGAESFSFTVYVQASTPPGASYTTHFTTVTAGEIHNCALSSAGLVYCWGSDFSGQRGDGISTGAPRVPTPVAIPGGANVMQLVSGQHFSCVLTAAGTVYCWGSAPGYTTWGQFSPVELGLPPGVTFTTISAGGGHACGLDADGLAYCWGVDGGGQLGNGPEDIFEHTTPTAVVMPSGVRFTSLSAGGEHTCAIGTNYRAYCWGYGDWGQLGVGERVYKLDSPAQVVLPDFETGFASISAGAVHTCAIMLSGKAYCWGDDYEGELGDGPSLAVAQYGPSAVAAPEGTTFNAVSARVRSTCAVASNGTAYCWGDDTYGVLGNGATTGDQHSPSQVVAPPGVFFTGIETGGLHTCASSTGPAYCWGLSYWGVIGDGAETDRDHAVAVAGTR